MNNAKIKYSYLLSDVSILKEKNKTGDNNKKLELIHF